MSPPVTTILIGNSGVGKSTILNCLLGKIEFKSGVSVVDGLTQVFQRYTTPNGYSYIDTPGLSDETNRKQAAVEIEKALKTDGIFKVFFVLTLESGRVKPDDKATMGLVLEAAPQIGGNYSLIINKIPPFERKRLDKEDSRKKLHAGLNEGLQGTTYIHYNTRNSDLEGVDDATVELDLEFLSFIQSAPTIMINKGKVVPIQIDKFEVMQKQYATQLEEMRKRFAAQLEEMAKSLDKNSQQIESLATIKTEQDKQIGALAKKSTYLERSADNARIFNLLECEITGSFHWERVLVAIPAGGALISGLRDMNKFDKFCYYSADMYGFHCTGGLNSLKFHPPNNDYTHKKIMRHFEVFYTKKFTYQRAAVTSAGGTITYSAMCASPVGYLATAAIASVALQMDYNKVCHQVNKSLFDAAEELLKLTHL